MAQSRTCMAERVPEIERCSSVYSKQKINNSNLYHPGYDYSLIDHDRVQFPPKLSRLSQYWTESVYRRLQDERSFIKNIAYSPENLRCLSRALDRF